MKKLENFSWKIWHIFSLVAVTVIMVGGIWSFFYLKEAVHVVSDRDYDYVGRGQRLLENRIISEEATGIPILAYSFKKEDRKNNPYICLLYTSTEPARSFRWMSGPISWPGNCAMILEWSRWNSSISAMPSQMILKRHRALRVSMSALFP